MKWSEIKQLLDVPGGTDFFISVETSRFYRLQLLFNSILLECSVAKGTADAQDFEDNYQSQSNNISNPLSPFASKKVGGKNLYNRTTGNTFPVSVGSNTLEFPITYPIVKFDGLDVLFGEAGDTADLKILDTATGTYSSEPNYLFNQFGFSVNIEPEFYRKESKYDADLYQGMRIVVEYTATVAKTIAINYGIHEVK